MYKKIITFIVMFFFLIFSSGIAVFAFECSLFNHVHFSLLKKVNCLDFHEENLHRDYIDIEHTHCCDSCSSCDSDMLYSTYNIKASCGNATVKILDLGIDTIVGNNFSINFKLLPELNKVDLLIHQFDYEKYFQTATHINDINVDFINLVRSHIIKFIQFHYSNLSESSDDFPKNI